MVKFSDFTAAQIRARAAFLGINVSDVARALGVTPQALYHKLRGKRPIDLDELAQIADFLKISIVDLIQPGPYQVAGLGQTAWEVYPAASARVKEFTQSSIPAG